VKEQLKRQKSGTDSEAVELDMLLAVLVLLDVPVNSKIYAALKLEVILKKREED
jgi:hypothetical protein